MSTGYHEGKNTGGGGEDMRTGGHEGRIAGGKV